MDKNFLITYDESGIYRFFSEDKVEYTLTLSTFGTRILPEVTGEDENFYMREFADSNLKIETFDLQNTLEESEQKIFNLNTTENVFYYEENKSFITSGEEVVNGNLEVEGGRAKAIMVAPIPDRFRVQLGYYGSVALIEGEYELIITYEEDEEEVTETIVLNCGYKNDTWYLGNYDFFMGTGGPAGPDSEEVNIPEDGGHIEIEDYISFSEEAPTQYKIIFQKEGEDPQEFYLFSKQIVEDEQTGATAAYIGNLNIYQSEAEDTGEPFFIITRDINLEESEKIHESFLYVRVHGTYILTVELYDLIEVPELVGAALVSFGNKQGSEITNNYGIGINSGDTNLTLPPRAISLFETQLESTDPEEDKISFKYRGILGTLSEELLTSLDMAPNIKPNMNDTQGIYTDNMYIGDANQYVAFYRDKNNKNKAKLDIKGNVYIGDSTLNSVVNIEDGAISLGDPNGFHIYIDGNSEHKDTFGLGFYDVNTRVAYINEEKLFIPYSVVLKGMDLGSQWRWELQENTNNLTLKWMGV